MVSQPPNLNSQLSTDKRRIPILPHRLVAKLPDQFCHLLWRALVGNVELSRRVCLGTSRSPLAGAQFDDSPALRVMQLFLARAGVTARLGMAAGAQQRDAERNQSIAKLGRFARG